MKVKISQIIVSCLFAVVFLAATDMTAQVVRTFNHPDEYWTGAGADLFPAAINVNIACGETILYHDEAGPDGDYDIDAGPVAVVFCPDRNPCAPATSPSLERVTLTFDYIFTESGFDFITVRNGPNANSPIVTGVPVSGGAFGFDPYGVITSTDPSGCLRVEFESDDVINNPGWQAVATLTGGCASLTECSLVCPAPGAQTTFSLSGCNPAVVPANLVTTQCPPSVSVVNGIPQVFNLTTVFQYTGSGPCWELINGNQDVSTSSGDASSNNCTGTAFRGPVFRVAATGTLCFDYNVVSNDADNNNANEFGYFDTHGYVVYAPGATPATINGIVLQSGNGGSGTVCIDVTAGQWIGLFAWSFDNFGGPLKVDYTNFSLTSETCPVVSIVQVAGPTPGTQLTAGIYTMKYEGFVGGQSIGKCSFPLTVTAVQPNLVCNDHVNISVDGVSGGSTACGVEFDADMFLEAPQTSLGCDDDDFAIYVKPYGGNKYLAANGTLSDVPVNLNTPGLKVSFINYLYQNGNPAAGPAIHTYEVVHPYGQKCWGTFQVEDKLRPTIDCGPIRSLYCFEVDDFVAEDEKVRNGSLSINSVTFRPSWADNCGGVTATFVTHKFLDGCNGGFLKRKWTIKDRSGNVAECDQHIEVHNDVNWYCPAPLVVLECKDLTSPEAISKKFREATGNRPDSVQVWYAYPHFFNGEKYVPVSGTCNYFSTYDDLVLDDVCGPHCHGNKKVIRTWTVLDWCTGDIFNCTQVIKAVDLEAPTFTLKPDTLVSTRPWDCTADFWLPPVWELHDNCDIAPTYIVKSPDPAVTVKLVNGKWRAYGAPCGDNQFKYIATDCCGNESEPKILTVKVRDLTPPVPVLVRDIVVGLTPGYDESGNPDGQAKLYAESVDNGSYDNCSPIKIEIRRKGTLGATCGNNGLNGHNNNSTFSNGALATNVSGNSSNDTDGGRFVKFCCEDLTSAGADFDGDGVKDVGYHEVEVRVWDDGNKDGIVGNIGDNYNDSWVIVQVDCKVPPVITCPPDKTIYCDWAIETNFGDFKPVTGVDFTKTGLPEAYGVCTTLPIEWKDQKQSDWTQCETGTIWRTFRTKDTKGNTRECRQVIRVLNSEADQPWKWVGVTDADGEPVDDRPIARDTCTEPSDADIKAAGPKWTAGPCDVIGVSTKVWRFDFEDGVCKKWKVEYKYVNWCTNEERGPYYRYFIYFDDKAPKLTCRDTMFEQGADCKLRNLMLTKVATDKNGCDAEGWLKWEVYVDLWGDGDNDYLYSSFVPNSGGYASTQGQLEYIGGDYVYVKYVAPTTSGGTAKITIPEIIEGKMSNHKVVWKVSDGCHNFASCHENFMVVDKKAPTPYCVSLSTALMAVPAGAPAGAKPMVELWARDFDKGSYDGDLNWPCTPQDDLLFTFGEKDANGNVVKAHPVLSKIDEAHYFKGQGQSATASEYAEGNAQRWLPSARSSAKIWDTDDYVYPYSDVQVMMVVWDKKYNSDYCWVSLKLICNGNGCPTGPGSRATISGNVSTEAAQTVSGVQVSFMTNIPEYPVTVTTGTNGAYSRSEFTGLDYEVSANKDGDDLNGVSTLDLVLIQRHILGIQKLNSPYKLIAADANNDGKVTASDLTELRKLILGVTTELASNSSWRFPITAQTMDAEYPFPFVEKIDIPAISGDMTNQNFVAVKIGDVNGNVSTNVSDPSAEGRSNKSVVMSVEDKAVVAGEIVEIPVTAANFNDVMGFQYTMNLNGASLVEVQAGKLEMNAANTGDLGNGVVTMSYASNESVSATANEVLFTVVVKAARNMNVSEMLSLNSAVTAAESYNSDLAVGKVGLEVRTAPVAGIELFQNEPNPFKGQTTVSFMMPEAAKAKLSIYDVTGKLVTVRNIDAAKGFNSEVFTREQLGVSGVMYYTLTSGEFSATKKMIIIE